MSKGKEIIVVSGLPRSGTSMMMQILQAGGIQLVFDERRPADINNPYGYFEYEKVKRLQNENSWLAGCQGKAIKILFHLLKFLPQNETFKVIFMLRNLNEVLDSQNRMLKSLNKPIQNMHKMETIFEEELKEVKEWLNNQQNTDVLFLDYNRVIGKTDEMILRTELFLGYKLNRNKILSVINPDVKN